ncbi:hypothetical protein SAMN05446927_6579 [Caballeronia arationis]|jgi:hypothetical protein|uniref:Uncharacterized protein n=1 Tax=Caballeronia arationis TaxID=1777142 RepID=A0A7Z7IC30_9BURK|nr:hypothetical protein [Caballeronia arationis]SOE87990.1 hypothetical protein SAMN05446927_6579 [Caballeronia arationis]
MERRSFFLLVGGLGAQIALPAWAKEVPIAKCLSAVDAKVNFDILWYRDGNYFEGDTYCHAAGAYVQPFSGYDWYVNEQGAVEKDNKVASVRLSETDNTSIRIRLLFTARNDHSILSDAGDVITAYTKDGQETHWTHSGNLLH